MTSTPFSAAPATGLSRRDKYFWSLFLIIAVGDYVTKRIVESQLSLHVPRPVIGDWVRFTLTYNPGAAMNLSLGDVSRVGFTAIACFMLILIFRFYRQTARTDGWQAVALGLIAGGALGNLMDRLRSARGVVDFIDVGIHDSRFWTFNLADSGVSVGAVLLALLLWRTPEPAQPAQPAAPAGER
jgi:signal peptidase II